MARGVAGRRRKSVARRSIVNLSKTLRGFVISQACWSKRLTQANLWANESQKASQRRSKALDTGAIRRNF